MAPDSSPVEIAEEEEPPVPHSPLRVAVVDDHPIIRSGVRALLECEPGFEWVGDAESPERAMDLLINTRPDAVVLDLWLGGNDGIEMIKCLRPLVPETALLCYTMNSASIYGERAIRAGAAGFLSKKEPQSELLVALRTVCRGGRYMNRELMNTVLDGIAWGRALEGHESLTDRELQVLRLLGMAMSNPDIALQLGLGVKTVNTHRENIKRKLGIRSSAELMRQAVLMVERGLFGG
ncbi:MAG: response regulator transcription factor [Akkermansiaceae bacterium]|jgi:DNA-binding NarL/FixJ family response regulator|nr:response regulator transcription factor [Akkermansiaceae bacterium]